MATKPNPELVKLFKDAIIKSDCILSSGIKSSFFVDGSKVSLSSIGIWQIINALYEATQDEPWSEMTAIAGPMTGADPIVAGFCYLIGQETYDYFKGVLVRKSTENGNFLVGPKLTKKDKVVVVDDVVSTGKQVIRAADLVRQTGAEILGIIGILDRNYGAEENIELAGYRYKKILGIEDLKKRRK